MNRKHTTLETYKMYDNIFKSIKPISKFFEEYRWIFTVLFVLVFGSKFPVQVHFSPNININLIMPSVLDIILLIVLVILLVILWWGVIIGRNERSKMEGKGDVIHSEDENERKTNEVLKKIDYLAAFDALAANHADHIKREKFMEDLEELGIQPFLLQGGVDTSLCKTYIELHGLEEGIKIIKEI